MQQYAHSESWQERPEIPKARNQLLNTKPTALLALSVWLLAAIHALALPTLDPTTPVNQTNRLGSDATYCVTASGTPPLSYQWRDYSISTVFTEIPGATNACLTLANVHPTTHRFRVVVCDPSGCATSRLATLTVLVPPIITNQPTDQVVGLGENYTNRVVVGGDPPLSYQWYFVPDGTTTTNLLAGKTANPLIITNVQFSNEGGYFVVVTNKVGTNISDQASLQVVTFPPAIVVQPADATVELGQTYTNQVVASGTAPLSYQWFFNGQLLAGKTGSTISIPNAQSSNSGVYSVVVTNLYGAVPSRLATAFVGVIFTKITSGPLVQDRQPHSYVAWGDYDNDGRLDLFVPTASLNYSPPYQNTLYRNLGGDEFIRVTNALTSAVAYNRWGAAWGDMDNDGDLDIIIVRPYVAGSTPTRNEMFLNDGGGVFTPMTNAVTSVTALWTDASWVDHNGDGWLDLFATTQSFSPGQPLDDYFFQNLGNGQFAAWTTNEVGVVLDPRTPTTGPAWCDIDGDGDLDLYVSKFSGATNFLYRNDSGRLVPVTAGSVPPASPTWIATWADFNNDGLIDLFTGGNGNNKLHLNHGSWVFEDVTAASGLASAGEIYAATAGDFDNDGDLDLYTSDYTRADVFYVNRGDGTFDRASVGSVLTEGVYNVQVIWVDYNNDGFLDLFQSCGDGQLVPNLLHRNSLPQSGNTNHWLKLHLKGTVSNADAIGARVWASATIRGKETRQVRELTLTGLGAPPPDGMRPHFGLGDATRVETLLVEWPSGRVTQMDYVAANQILTITEPTNDLPSIVIQPADQTNLLGTDATFCVTATGTPPLSYQWRDYSNANIFANIPGATNACLLLPNVQPTTHRFAVVVSNPSGSIASRLAKLIVRVPPIITNQPTDQVIGLGENYTNRVVVGGDAPLSYQWYFVIDGTTNLLAGKTAIPLIITNVQFSNAGGYFVVVTNFVGTNISLVATMQVITIPPAIVVQPADATVELGQTYSNRVVAAGTVPLAYQWFFNDQPLTGKTNSTITIPNIQATNAGGYSVLVTNPYGATNSRVAGLTVLPVAFAKITQGEVLNGDTDMVVPYWVDYNNDERLDLVVAGGYRTVGGKRLLLYDNKGDGTFGRNLTNTLATTLARWIFLSWGDYDNDGNLDVYAGQWEGSPGWYFHNEGGGRFGAVQANSSWTINGQPVYGETTACADYDGDGWLDLMVGYWGNTGPGIWGTNSLLHNVGGGRFEVDLHSALALSGTWPETFAWVDYDGDGDQDLFTATSGNNSQLDILFENRGGGNFQRVTNSPLVQAPDVTVGQAWGDYDNDGDLDVLISNWNQTNLLYRNLGNGVLEIDPAGPNNHIGDRPEVAQWGDFDNDGYLDLFLAQEFNHCRIFHNRADGTLEEVVAGAPASESGIYGCAWGDYDNDGFLDLVLVKNSDEANHLYRNVLKQAGNTNQWLKVALRGTASNRAAIGATVRAKATIAGRTFWQRRQIVSQSHQLDLLAHFGLGDATNVETLRVEWPSGHVTELHNITANQLLTIQEPPGLECVGRVGGAFQLRVVGNIGERYDVLTSSDAAAPATNWVRWQTVTNTSRTMTVTDPSPNAPQRFYKAMPAP